MNFTLLDEDGFIAIVNADKYKSFVGKDWTLSQLLARFAIEMNNQNIIVWQANNHSGGQWQVQILDEPSELKAIRQFDTTIKVTSGKLYLTTYSDLTMAAQFEDELIPSEHNLDLCFKIANGTYKVTVRQMFNTKTYDFRQPNEVDFEITFSLVNNGSIVIETDGVYWWTD